VVVVASSELSFLSTQPVYNLFFSAWYSEMLLTMSVHYRVKHRSTLQRHLWNECYANFKSNRSR